MGSFLKNLFMTVYGWVNSLIMAIFGPVEEGSDTKIVRVVKFLVAFIVLTFLLQVAFGQFSWWADVLESFLSTLSSVFSATVEAGANAIPHTGGAITPSDVPVVPSGNS
jgi:hypothetical protein